jgi:multiple sugar transport system substrate-binding protein
MKRWLCVAVLALVLLFSSSPGRAQERTGEGVTLRVCWASWHPADLLLKLSEDFTAKTGTKVEGLFVPWGDFLTKVRTEMTTKSSSIDLVVLDSQWLGWMVEGGHLVDLTDWLKKESGIDLNDYYEATLKAYGEYPPGSGRLYAITCEQDLEGLVYRKDLFEDAKEKEAFKAAYGYELGVPETWDQLRDIAEFFYRPDDNLYGLATKWSRDYDVITWDFAQVLWAFGGDYWDPKTLKVEGILNSPASVKALTFYRDLSKFAAPGAAGFSFDEVNQEMQQGRAAMAIQWFAFFPGFVDPKASRTWDKVGFAPVPAGPKGRFVALGGQGIGIPRYSKNKQAALSFIKWFQSVETQWAWAKGGGLTGRKSIVNDPAFAELFPFNTAFRDSLPHAKDIWNLPEYAKLLEPSQEKLNEVIRGKLTPKAALDAIAAEHEKVLAPRRAKLSPPRPRRVVEMDEGVTAEARRSLTLPAVLIAAAVVVVVLMFVLSRKNKPQGSSPQGRA